MRGDRGQASIELLGSVPYLALGLFAALQLTVAATTVQAASSAARAAARTVSQGDGDPQASAQRSVPDWLEAGMSVTLNGGESPSVTVTLQMPIIVPGLDSGPEVARTAWFEREQATPPWG
ncbi:hypothetical protein LWF15_02275 [Kineosporia rhizophila]|uniref:hypothetical protein n=1 Tax=Kineosporia TaxID=49184 RepID=UPI001E2DCAC7|nr:MULTISPECIES: hypothetical protein [Kineosporia]MCE0534326.1 hypothetical protein [Kineosporia rhizophila]GLY13874.1 hypothetical protein Kisp01_08900 [Kineosporia sp. NBRC 101677]